VDGVIRVSPEPLAHGSDLQRARAAGRRKSICFVAPETYPVLIGDRSVRVVGGAEVQQCILAREFARRGYDVSMICMDYGQAEGTVVDGIKVHRMHAPNQGIPVLRFIHPRFTSVWSAMRRANADVYYQRTAGALTAFVVAFAKLHQRTSVFASASDRDFAAELPHIAYARDRMLFRWAVRRANHVVTQTSVQSLACQKTAGRQAAVIRSCYGHRGKPANPRGLVLWVGNVRPVKRAELFVELARRLPDLRFKLIGDGPAGCLDALRTLATGLTNIEFTGFVPYADIEAHFDGAALLVNTSSSEGFPNTFLQAWSRGIPTVSFFDIGAELDGQAVATTVPSLDEMRQQVQGVLADEVRWREKSARASTYFGMHFSVEGAIDEYESLLHEVTRRQSPAAVGVE
jgi:glycosyltransferase involved in cell wall biosynthesis